MRYLRVILSVSLLAFALAWSLWYVFGGFGNPMDPFYWLHKYASLESGWMSMGTILAGGAIVRLFGAQLLPLRIAGWCCTVAAIALPYGCLLNREQRINNLHWLAVAYGLMGYGAFQEFSPGTLTVLLLSAIWVCTAKSPITNHKLQILTAILAGLAVAVRFPNILVFLVLIPLWRKKSLWLVPIAALAAAAVYGIGYWCITPAYADPAMSSHGMSEMITKLWEKGAALLGYALMWIGVLAIGKSKKLKFEIKNLKSEILLGILVGAIFAYYITYVPFVHQWYNYDVTYLVSAACLVLAVGYWPCTNSQLSTLNSQLIIGALLLVVASLGTDTAWLKLFPAVVCLLAVAVVNYDASMRRYLFLVFVGLTAAVMMRFSVNCIGDYNLRHCTVTSTVAPYEHIALRPDDERHLKQYKTDYDFITAEYPDTKVISLGREMHRIRAVTGCEAARYNEFWSNIFDSVYTAKYKTIIEAEHPIVFCSFAPGFKTKPSYKDKHSALEEMLREEGYKEIDRSADKYMIYIPE